MTLGAERSIKAYSLNCHSMTKGFSLIKVIGVLNSAGPVCCDPEIMEITDLIEEKKDQNCLSPTYWVLDADTDECEMTKMTIKV